jgi:predicted peroxiredoxin
MFAVLDLSRYGININMTINKASEKGDLLIIGTHSDDNLEKAMLTFMVANAAVSIGVKTSIFLMSKGTDLAKKGYAKGMPKMGGMEPMEDLIATFQEMEGSIHVCIPCKDARGVKASGFLVDCEFSTLMDLVEMTQTFPRVISL